MWPAHLARESRAGTSVPLAEIDLAPFGLLACFVSVLSENFDRGKAIITMARDVFVLGGKRTPMGEYVGALKDTSAIDLGAIAARAALETTGVAPNEIDHTIIGNALQ